MDFNKWLRCLALSAGLSFFCGFLQAEVSDKHLEKIEKMHFEAENFIATNQFDRAIQKYGEIILAEPDDETAYANLGNVELILGNYAKAEDAFQNALSINPSNETALTGLEKIRDPDGRFGESAYPKADPDPPTQ